MAGQYRTRPVNSSDNAGIGSPGRRTWYDEEYVVPAGIARQVLGDEASYFSLANPTLGTAIVGHVAPSLANNDPTPTKSLLHIYNSGNKWISMDFFTLRFNVVNASATATGFLVYTDVLGATGRTSGGTALTPVASKGGTGNVSGAVAYFGAVVTAAATSVNRHFGYYVRPVIAVIGDQYTFSFGSDVPLAAGVPINGTNNLTLTVPVGPVTIAPGGNFYLCEANPSGAATGATYEFVGGFTER